MLYCRIWNDRKKYLLVLVLSVVVVLPLAQAQRSAIVFPRNLAQLSGWANIVVRAHVIEAHFKPHPNHPNLGSVVVTLSVEEVLKGTAGKILTFRQFEWDPRDRLTTIPSLIRAELPLMLGHSLPPPLCLWECSSTSAMGN
jgi:hypothetical protein